MVTDRTIFNAGKGRAIVPARYWSDNGRHVLTTCECCPECTATTRRELLPVTEVK